MLVLRPDFGVEEKPARDLAQKLIGDREIKTLSVLGKKQLAYPIKKQSDAVYVAATFVGAPLKVDLLETQMKMGPDILRYLLIAKGPASSAGN